MEISNDVSILIVEDDFYLAADFERELRNLEQSLMAAFLEKQRSLSG